MLFICAKRSILCRMRKLVLTCAALCLSTPALAQDNVIRIINEDGSVQEIELFQPAPPSAPQPSPQTVPVPPEDALVAPELQQLPPAAPQEPATALAPAAPEAEEPKAKPKPKKRAKPGPKPTIGHRKTKARLVIPEGTSITRELAIAIALEHAPPARTMLAYPRIYKDTPVFEVVFKTEEGDHVILVERETGKILNP